MIEIALPEPKPLKEWPWKDKAILRARKKFRKGLVKRLRKAALKRARLLRSRKPVSEKKPVPGKQACRFDETPLGYLLKHECPLEWSMLCDIATTKKRADVNLILYGIMSSGNPLFDSDRYVSAIKDFKENGFYTPSPQRPDLERELSYIETSLNNEEEPGLTV